jgi:hypothetical protein
MAYAQTLAAAIETQVYDTLHTLLGQIAKDYELSHGELVDKYLVKGREGSPPPQFIYTKGDLSDSEDEVKPKRKAAKVKVTKAKSDSEEERDGKCTAKTAKGLPCKNKAFGGGCMCRVHTPKEGEEPKGKKEPKAKKAPAKRGRKVKKSEPEHSHKMDELAGSDCELCETHGNPLEGDQEFEVENAEEVVAALRAEESEEGELSEDELEALAAELKQAMEEGSEVAVSEEELE